MKLKHTMLGASILTVISFAYAGYGLFIDPVMTPLRVIGAVLLATGLGGTWGRVIWDMRQH